MLRVLRCGVLLLVLILALAGVKPASAACIYNTSAGLYTIDGEVTCAYSGGGCSSCFTRSPRGDGSWDLCYYDWLTGDIDCFSND